jgi:predicted phage gp36 major capsid-like protein
MQYLPLSAYPSRGRGREGVTVIRRARKLQRAVYGTAGDDESWNCTFLAWVERGVNALGGYSIPRYTLRTISFWRRLAALSCNTVCPV